MSSSALGSRVGVSAQGVRQLEQAEADGGISLKTLARLADGLDCDVHYTLVPRTSLVEQVLKRTHELAGIPAPPIHLVTDAVRMSETLDALYVMLGQVNKRGLW